MSHDVTHFCCWQGGRPDLSTYPTVVEKEHIETLPELEPLQTELEEAQRRLWAHRQKAVLIILQGLDASGKDSMIRTINQALDPVAFRAWSFGRPTEEEARHDFLWRVGHKMPGFGQITVFNRSQCEAVLAERLLPDAIEDEDFWRKRCHILRDYESHLARCGTTIIKVWLHQSKEEQRDRLLKRLDQPRKRWKFDASDVDTFQDRERYLSAMEFAVAETHCNDAPWYLVPNDDKKVARRIVLQLLLQHLNVLAPDYPDYDNTLDDRFRKLLLKDRKKND